MPTYHNLTTSNLSQDWDPGFITITDSWPATSSIIGYLGDIDGGSPTGVDPRTLTGPALGTVDVVANTSSGNPSSGGVLEVTVGGNTMVGLNGSGTADAPSLVLYLDATDREQVALSFDAIDTDATDNSVQQLNVQYRTSPTGDWINVPGGYFSDVSVSGTGTTPISVVLPIGADNASALEVRIMTTNAAGNDEFIGIDNIVVASEPLIVDGNPGTLSINDMAATEGDGGTTDMTFTVTRTSGSDGEVSVDWSVVHGSTDAADFSGPTSGSMVFADGETSKTITIQVAGDLAVELTEAFTLALANPQGGVTITDGAGAGTIATDDLPQIANVWINEFHYDPSSVPETGEFIEIAGQAGIDLSGYRLVLYNGNGGAPYEPSGGSAAGISLSGVIGDTANGFGFTSVPSPGLQNGSPDGIALVDNFGRVVQFLSYEGTMTATGGPAAGLTSTDIGRFEGQATPGTSLQLSGTGSTYADFTWTFGNTSTSGGANGDQNFLSGTDQGQIRLDNASVVEGDSGETLLVFTLHRSGGFATETSVDYSIGFGTADTADLAPGTPLAGTVTFAPGELTQTITIPVAGDTVPEFNEWLFVELGAVTGNAVVVDAMGVGTILNNDPLPLTIMQIQGEGHVSEFDGQPVLTSGIVTAVAANGFYLQDSAGDGNTNTSDGIFVFTSSAPTVAVGDRVDVAGRVNEFGSDLPLTEINVTGNAAFGVSVTSNGNALPASILVGQGGILPPTESIDSDGLTIFNPQVDGADFWESMEGMLVTIDRPQVIANSDLAFGETFVVASLGEGATGLNGSGGLTVGPGDFNPELIQIDDQLIAGSGYVANHSVGDQLGSLTGILNYSFAHYELLMTDVPETTVDVTLQPETVGFVGDANYMTVATLNVENLDPSDGKYDEIADQIVNHLGLPDVIAIQEMQDDNGTGTGVLSAAANAQNLIDAIFLESGITYAYAEIAPTVANSTGGEANGNIRNGYLHRVDRVDLVEGSLAVIEDASYSNSRLPLVATWEFQGQQITTINVHFFARSGGDPLWGGDQPPAISGDDRRTDQADAVGDWINDQLATNPSLNVSVLGDWNGFYFETAQTQLTGLVNLQALLLPEEERYSYLFDGNGQLLDNILVTNGLLAGAGVDAVHINAYFGEAAISDHDPQVARFLLGTAPSDIAVDNAAVAENLAAGSEVGTVTATDAAGDTLTYSLADNAGGLLAIHSQTGVITTTAALDHEALASLDIVVRVTDGAGQTSDQAFVIAVTDVNEAPTASADSAAVSEDATTGNLWAQLLANDADPDAGDSLGITAIDTSGTLGSLIFDPATQTLRYVADHDSFDAIANGATALDTFTYTVTDESGLTHTATVTMTVTGANDSIVRTGGNGNEVLVGGAGEDQLFGNNGDDRLEGGDGHDLLEGGRGNDVLFGGTGNDSLAGGRGNDELIGGTGNDMLTGGSGDDSFLFGANSGSDLIVDFDVLHDVLRLEGGQVVTGSHNADLNGDGFADLVIELDSGTVGLLGVGSLGDVQFEGDGAAAAVMSWSASPQTYAPDYLF